MFHTPLRVEWVRGSKDKAILTEALIYETWAQNLIDVPAGFQTDFASVPRLFRGIFPKAGKYRDAAVVHDYLYRHCGLDIYSRRASDKIFSQAMADLGVSWWRRAAIYRAVRIGGGKYWTTCNE